jgi:hypothetical protein
MGTEVESEAGPRNCALRVAGERMPRRAGGAPKRAGRRYGGRHYGRGNGRTAPFEIRRRKRWECIWSTAAL